MAVRTKAELEAIVAATIDSAGSPRISAADVRSVLQDFLDSLAFLTDIPTATGVTEARVNQLIAAALTAYPTLSDALAAIMAGTQIAIDRTTDGQITISFEPAAVGTHTRYAVWAATGATPTAADFLAGATSMSGTITVPATPGGTASFLHFADIHDQLSGIAEAGSAFDSRGLFEPNPTALAISGVQHYVYSSRFALNPYSNPVDWTLTP